jgi:hypothetical protein
MLNHLSPYTKQRFSHITFYWYVTLCGVVDTDRRFGVTYFHKLQLLVPLTLVGKHLTIVSKKPSSCLQNIKIKWLWTKSPHAFTKHGAMPHNIATVTVTATKTENLRSSDIYNKDYVHITLCFYYTRNELMQVLCTLDRSHDTRVYLNLF